MNTKALIAAIGLAASFFSAPILQAQTQPVDQVVAIVDRLQGGKANFDARGLPFEALLTIEDLGVKMPQTA